MAADMNDAGSGFGDVFRRQLTESAALDSRDSNSIFSGRPALFNRTVGLTSSGSARWLGLSYEKTWSAGHQFWCRGYVSQGNAAVTDWSRFLRNLERRMPSSRVAPAERTETVDVEMEGWAAHLGGYVFMGQDWYLYPYALAMSGDDGIPSLSPDQSNRDSGGNTSYRYGGFLSVVPYLESTNIFFNGGLANGFSARQVSLPGLAGRG